MKLGTISLLLGIVAAVIGILYHFAKAIHYNNARGKAQQGRILSLFKILQIQSIRLTGIEERQSKIIQENVTVEAPDNGLITLENDAFEEYKQHETKIT
jgi:hypothetical protein